VIAEHSFVLMQLVEAKIKVDSIKIRNWILAGILKCLSFRVLLQWESICFLFLFLGWKKWTGTREIIKFVGWNSLGYFPWTIDCCFTSQRCSFSKIEKIWLFWAALLCKEKKVVILKMIFSMWQWGCSFWRSECVVFVKAPEICVRLFSVASRCGVSVLLFSFEWYYVLGNLLKRNVSYNEQKFVYGRCVGCESTVCWDKHSVLWYYSNAKHGECFDDFLSVDFMTFHIANIL
jgi:hypothetical protein